MPAPPPPRRPPDDESGLSRRDRDLARLERLLSAPPMMAAPSLAAPGGPEEAAEPPMPEPIDAAELADVFYPSAAGLRPAPPRPARARRPEGTFSFFRSALLQTLIISLVIIWVFILGILVGRSRLTENGWSRDMMNWLERKAGWEERSRPVAIFAREDEPAPSEPGRREPASPEPAAREPFQAAAGPPDGGPALISFYDFDEPWNQDLVWSQDPWNLAPADAGPEPEEAPGRYAIQTDLIPDEAEAMRRAEKLRELGFSAYLESQDGLFFVRAGPFRTSEEAEKALKTLGFLGYKNARVIDTEAG